MKRFIIIYSFIVCDYTAAAQEQTLIGENIESGYFGGPAIKVTKINNENAVLVGGKGGWIINHAFVIGGAGYGLVTNVNAIKRDSIYQYIELGYGGLDLEFIASSDNLIHYSIEVLIGAGGVDYKRESDSHYNRTHKMDYFFVLEPSVQAILNITHYFRVAGGVSYRYISGLHDISAGVENRILTTNDELSGLSATLTLKFGMF